MSFRLSSLQCPTGRDPNSPCLCDCPVEVSCHRCGIYLLTMPAGWLVAILFTFFLIIATVHCFLLSYLRYFFRYIYVYFFLGIMTLLHGLGVGLV
jgi:hypothetical protein